MGNIYSTAAGCRGPDVAKELLKHAAAGDVDALNSVLDDNSRLVSHYSVFGGNSAWHKAAKSGNVPVLEALEAAVLRQYELGSKDLSETLSKPGVLRLGSSGPDAVTRLINKSNIKGFTPLMLACSGSHTAAVSWLIKHGADVWKHDRVRRHTALHCAAEVGATDAIRLLLAHAGSEAHPGNHRTLLEQGNHAGLTALHYAVYCEQHEVVAQLVAQDADITAQAEFPDLDWGCVNAGDTAMHIAAHKGNIDAIQIMLKAYNEKSGAFLPNQDSSRRLRDPRAMRNDYGRLPYHLAMRKGLTWLGEMLDPSVPVRFLLTDDQLDSNTEWGPPRLTTIAAAVLHRSLVADLKAIQAAQGSQQVAQAATPDVCCSTTTTPPPPPSRPSLLQVAQQQQAALRAAPPSASVSPSDEAGSSTTGSSALPGRRRWARSGHRRSNSDATGWVGRLSEISPLAASASRRLSTGGMSRGSSSAGGGNSSSSSRRVRAPSPAAALLATANGDSRISNLQDALGPLSPRAIVAAIVGTAAAGGSGGEAATSSSSSSASATAGELQPLAPLGGPSAAAAAPLSSTSPGGAWRRLARQARLVGARQQQHHNAQHDIACASPELDECCLGGQQQQQQAADGDEGQHEPKMVGCSSLLLRSASDSLCHLALDEGQQQDCCSSNKQQQQQQHEAKGHDDIPAMFDSGKVSPFPELKPDLPDAVLEGLLEHYMTELRSNGSTASPSHAPAGQHQQQHQQQQACDGGSTSSDDAHTCGVCLDAVPSAMINPCEHTMCAECALDMCERCPLGTAMCPFCRCIIKSFAPVSSSSTQASGALMSGSATGTAGSAPAAAAAAARVALPVC